MRKLLIPALVLVFAALALAAPPQEKWEAGTILNVAKHAPAQDEQGNYLYDMTVQVGEKTFVVLYDSPLDSEIGNYKQGIEVTVLVGESTMKLNDIMGRTHDLPILAISEPQKPR